jgi:hypothetical protein
MTQFANYAGLKESPTHLCKDCPYTKEVWEDIELWFHLSILNTMNTSGSLQVLAQMQEKGGQKSEKAV